MTLEEWWEYETIWHHKVNTKESFEYEEMIDNYGDELVKILGIWNKPSQERDMVLKGHKVLYGNTNADIMPSGTRHAQTGKCLWGNTGWIMGNGKELKKRLKNFDIDLK